MPEKNLYAEENSRAFDNAESDYVREILRDGQITAAEVRDSQEHNNTCLSEAGISAEYVDHGEGYKSLVIIDPRDDLLDAEFACHDKWVGEVHSIYVDQITNPMNGDFEALIAACLIAKGLVLDGFTGADFRELMEQSGETVSVSEPSDIIVEVGEPIMLPGGESMNNPQAMMCLTNPSL